MRAAGRLVRGWWGLLPEVPLPGAPEAGIRLYHLGRLVGAPEWFGHPTPAAHPALNAPGRRGRAAARPGDDERGGHRPRERDWAAVEARLHAVLAPVVRRLTREPASAVTAEAARTAEQVRRIAGQGDAFVEEGRCSNPRSRSGRRDRWPAGARRRPKAGPDARRRRRRGGRRGPRSLGRDRARAAPSTLGRSRRSGDDPPPRVGRGGRAPPRSAPPQRARRGGRRAQGGDQQRVPTLRGPEGRPLVPARDGPSGSLCDHPGGDGPGVRAPGQRADAGLAGAGGAAQRGSRKGVAAATAVRGRQTGLWR